MYYYVTSMVLITTTFLIAVIIGYKKRNKISKQLLTGLFLILSAGAITLAFILYPYCLTLQHRVADVDLPFIVDQNIHPDEYGADFQKICKIVKIHYLSSSHARRIVQPNIWQAFSKSQELHLVGEETAGDFGTDCETFQTSRGTCFSLGVGVLPLTANGNLTEGVGVKPHYTITEQDDKSIRETALRKTFFMYLKKEIEKKKKKILEKRGKEGYKENKN